MVVFESKRKNKRNKETRKIPYYIFFVIMLFFGVAPFLLSTDLAIFTQAGGIIYITLWGFMFLLVIYGWLKDAIDNYLDKKLLSNPLAIRNKATYVGVCICLFI